MNLKNSIKIGRFKIGIKSVLTFAVVVAFLIASYFFILRDIPSTATIGTANYPQSTNIYDRNGKLLYAFFASRNQTFVASNKIPDKLKQATIAKARTDFIPILNRPIFIGFFKFIFNGNFVLNGKLLYHILTHGLVFLP